MIAIRVISCFHEEAWCPFTDEVKYDSCSIHKCVHPEAPDEDDGLMLGANAVAAPVWCPLRKAEVIVRLRP